MALFWKVTIAGRIGVQGFTESWTRINVGIAPGDQALVINDARNLTMLRAATCGLGVFIRGVRISYQDAPKKRSEVFSMDPLALGLAEVSVDSLTGYADPVTRSADQPTSSIQHRITSADGRAKNYWMAGIPDAVIRTNPDGVTVATSATWETKYNAWKAEMLSGKWGFPARTLGTTDPIIPALGLTRQTVGLGIVGVIVSGAPTIPRPNRVQLRGFKPLSRLVPKITGTYSIDSIDTTTLSGQSIYFLRDTEQFDPDAYDNIGTIQRVGLEAVPINSVNIYRQGRHKRGRPFGQQAGRRSNPLRLPS